MKFALNLSVLSTLWLVASNNVAQAQDTIAVTVAAASFFSTLERVMLAVDGAEEFLENDDKATVFAPTNTAFEAADQEFLAKLLTPPFNPHLQDLLFYHVIPEELLENAFDDGSVFQTLGSESLTFTREEDGTLLVDGLSIATPNIIASNGVIHIMDNVLLPSWVSFSSYETLTFFTDLTTLVTSIDDAMLTDTLNGPGPFTIFAPFNDAFTALNDNPDVDFADMDFLSTVLLTHVVDDVIALAGITDGMEVASLSGEMLTFNVDADGGVTVNGILMTSFENLSSNGVVHILGEVILPTPPLLSITEIVVAGEDFSTLEVAVLAVEGAADFLQNDEVTVFAPTNAAFAAINQEFLTKLLTPPFQALLRELLGYHIIPGTVRSADIMDGTVVETFADDSLSIAKAMDGSITINGDVNVVELDVAASNGVIHVVDAVLLAPWVSITAYSLAASIDDTSTLVSLIDGAMLTDALNGPGPFTVFAPTNAAFEAASSANPDLDITDMDLVSTILQMHVVDQIIFSEDITDGMEVTALSGETLTFDFTTDGGVTVNGILISLDDADNSVNNGVVHILGEVILPTPAATAAPVATTTAPAAMTAAPVATTAAPVATTTAPVATTNAPVATTTTAPVAAPTAAPNSSASGLASFISAAMASFVAMML